MLGKLARWLRMLGHDVEYSIKMGDNELLAVAKKENRVLLTRDFELYHRAVSKGIEVFYVNAKNETGRLAQLASRYSLDLEIDMDKSYCPKCGAKLNPASKEQIQNDVEANTLLYNDKFWKCHSCGQVYWQGAHWKKITDTLKTAQQKQQF
jgi:uncharacterized protein with PIN domain